eukprot:gb/GEZJ01003658.1/.p1 GENE.gb/GEZJ01003658.1/~~gb/GEZJ01003658.1/.p1  ORF type:complete len:119 (+),score=15.22 gb/GEZJ01003658.1/:630-986(+)
MKNECERKRNDTMKRETTLLPAKVSTRRAEEKELELTPMAAKTKGSKAAIVPHLHPSAAIICAAVREKQTTPNPLLLRTIRVLMMPWNVHSDPAQMTSFSYHTKCNLAWAAFCHRDHV